MNWSLHLFCLNQTDTFCLCFMFLLNCYMFIPDLVIINVTVTSGDNNMTVSLEKHQISRGI